jgi:hypothetical protein
MATSRRNRLISGTVNAPDTRRPQPSQSVRELGEAPNRNSRLLERRYPLGDDLLAILTLAHDHGAPGSNPAFQYVAIPVAAELDLLWQQVDQRRAAVDQEGRPGGRTEIRVCSGDRISDLMERIVNMRVTNTMPLRTAHRTGMPHPAIRRGGEDHGSVAKAMFRPSVHPSSRRP